MAAQFHMTALANGPVSSGALQITTSSLSNATVGSAYSASLAASGGSGSGYTFSQVSAAPNNGLWLHILPNGTVGGTPSYAETETATFQVTDSLGNTAQATFSLSVTTSGSLAIASPTTLPSAVENGYYAYQLFATGGYPPYGWSTTGTPDPWYLTSDGWIVAAPTTGSTLSIPVTVTDSNGATATQTESVSIVTTLTIAGIDPVDGVIRLPPAMAGNAYSARILAYGGTGSGYTYSATGLPSWATLSSAGILSGTPAVSGNIAPTLKVTDSGSNTSSATALLNISSSGQVSRPSYNSSSSNGFFVLNGQLYDPNGYPFRIRGLDRAHYNSNGWDTSGSPANGALTAVNAVRFFMDSTNAANNVSTMTTQHIDHDELAIFALNSITRFMGSGSFSGTVATISAVTYGALAVGLYLADDNGNFYEISSFGTGSGGVGTYNLASSATTYSGQVTATVSGNSSGDTSASDLGGCAAWWVTNASAFSSVMGNMMMNVANEWGPGNSTTWQYAYQAASGAISAMSTTSITLSTVSGTNPFANALAIGYAYIKGASGVANQLVPITAVGGSSGAWTVTGTFPSGYTSGGTLWGGAIGIIRAAGYTNPILVDSGGSGQDQPDLVNYAASVQSSDPLQNIVFSYHAYGNTNNYAAPISSVATGSSTTVVTLSTVSTNHPLAPFYPTNGGTWDHYSVSGAQGMTQLNGRWPATVSVGGSSGAWTVTLNVNSSSWPAYTGGGTMTATGLDSGTNYEYQMQLLGSLAASNVAVIIGEFGPGQNVGPSPTTVTPQQIITAAEANDLGWIYWAWDDNNGGGGSSTFTGTFSATLSGPGTYAPSLPSDLTGPGLDLILSPRYGLSALASPAASFL